MKRTDKIIQVGCLAKKSGSAWDESRNQYRVYFANGICPTLNAMNGGGRQPYVVVKDVRIRQSS